MAERRDCPIARQADLTQIKDARMLAEEAGIPWAGLSLENLRSQLHAYYTRAQQKAENSEKSDPTGHRTAQVRHSSSLGRLFAAVDGDGDGDLDRAEVAALLKREGLDASDAHVDGIFDRYERAPRVRWILRG